MSTVLDRDLLAIQEMRDAVAKAKEAQAKYMSYSQEQVDKIVKAVADAAYAKSYELAVMAVEETGMGVVEHKKIKNEVGSRDVYEWIKDEKTVGIVGENKEKKVLEIAAPFGVVAAIIPTTNPTSTAFFKTLIALKTRNAIVVSPHPYAVKCTIEALKVCEKAAVEAGAPEGLVGWLSHASMEATQALMKYKDVHLILATGGGGLVKAAYSSGKPAYGVGPGNVPCYIEKTAKIEKSISMIVDSKSFDYGTICATEQAMVVDKNVYTMAVRELKKNGAYILNAEEKARMEKVISPVPGKVNPKIVGRSPAVIAKLAGIDIDDSVRLFVGEETEVGRDIPFSLEKLSPVFALYKAESQDHAKELCGKLLDLGGRGHSLSIHTEDDQVAREFALEMPVSRILVNTLSSVGAVGGTTGLAPSMTLGCGTFGGNITSDNITAKHLLNIKRMAYGIKDVTIPKKGSIQAPPAASSYSQSKEDETSKIVKGVLSSMGKTDQIDVKEVSELVSKIIEQYNK
ncbi:acetaldehyde dehydrogenase (acetylating) [Bacillus ectoiniformans]|uniref:aldehyde dehydrogenase family protein n=1 Tax=Bacillus ectoiniformans TaxID=1494429 RepID=UPI00195AE6BD|nr:aldehyde dehydrogenase family protein [Bacillus ectoiniformans]MBM7649289.1 acetaldehyde dehydrogenase (acetylating) [Bacillus ectoiniformans]